MFRKIVMKLHRFNIWTFITIVAFFVLILFVLYPLLSLFDLSFTSPETGKFSLEGYHTFITDSIYRILPYSRGHHGVHHNTV